MFWAIFSVFAIMIILIVGACLAIGEYLDEQK